MTFKVDTYILMENDDFVERKLPNQMQKMCLIRKTCRKDALPMDRGLDQSLLEELVSQWYRNDPSVRGSRCEENRLFEMLYRAYCRRVGSTVTFQSVAEQGTYSQVCSKMFSWYRSRYANDFKMRSAKNKRGQKREAIPCKDGYTFDLLYCDARQFKTHLLSVRPQAHGQEQLSFVLHTAVAFMVPPAELDEVLQYLGFHPLHVKNLHHLAIYTVLFTANNKAEADTRNPFECVKSLYFRACEILRQTDRAQTDGSYSFYGQKTLQIRKSLFDDGRLTEQSFENIVTVNGAEINARHSLILNDFHKLASVFATVFDTNEPIQNVTRGNEAYYSFYAFVFRYCNDHLSRKKFRELLTCMIDNLKKHPTRSVLILLWLYAFCFSFTPGVWVEPTAFRKIVRQLGKYNAEWPKAAEACYDCGNAVFHIGRFLCNGQAEAFPRRFVGSDFIAYINEKLLLRYGLGQLNAKLPFDHCILRLGELDITLCDDEADRCREIFCGKRRLAESYACADGVPVPLAVITELLDQWKKIAEKEAAEACGAAKDTCPLRCSLYEQL